MKKLQKLFSVGVIFSLVLSLLMAPLSASAAVSAGTLIKTKENSAVYFLASDGKRYAFPDLTTYASWFADFDEVQVITQEELISYKLGGNATIKPGTYLVKITTDPKVYAIEDGGNLLWIESEEVAIALYGEDWATTKVVDVPDTFITSYKIGGQSYTSATDEDIEANKVAADTYPQGSLIQKEGSSDIYYINAEGEAQKIAATGFDANNFQDKFVIKVDADFELPELGDEISSKVDSFSDVSAGGKVATGNVADPAAGSGLTVTLAADTPQSANIPQLSMTEFTKLAFTASNDGDVQVKTITITAGGMGNAQNIDSVVLYNENDERIVSNDKNINSSKEAQFNLSPTLIIPEGETRKIAIRAIVSSSTSIHNLGIKSADDISTNGAKVTLSGSTMGNDMSATEAEIGTLIVSSNGTPSTINLGDTDAVIAKVKIENNDVEDLNLYGIAFKRNSTLDTNGASAASDDDFENLRLVNDGKVIATADAIKSKFLSFRLDTPLEIEKSKNETFEIKAEIVDGANKYVEIILDNVVDVVAKGEQYMARVGNGLTNGSELKIEAGTISIGKVQPPLETVDQDEDDVVLGTLKITSNGGNVEMDGVTIKVEATGDTAANGVTYANMENLELYDATGGGVYDFAYTSTNDATTTKYYQIDSEMDLALGKGVTHEMQIRMDILDNAPASLSYKVTLVDASADLTILETSDDVAVTDMTPNSVTFSKVEVESSSVEFSKQPLSANYSVVAGASDVDVFYFGIEANDTSDLKITELKFANDTTASTVDNTIVSGFSIWADEDWDSDNQEPKSGKNAIKSVGTSQLSNTDTGVVTFSSLSIVIPKGEIKKFHLTTNTVGDTSNDGVTMKFRLSEYDAEETNGEDNDTVYDSTNDGDSDGSVETTETGFTALASGRTVELAGAGFLQVAIDNENEATDDATYAIAGGTSGLLAAIKLQGENEDILLKTLAVTATNTTGTLSNMISKIELLDSDKTTVLASEENISTTTTFDPIKRSGSNVYIGQTETVFYVKVTLNSIGKDRIGDIDASTKFQVTAIEAEGKSSNSELADDTDGNCSSEGICWDADGDGTYADATTNSTSSLEFGVLASRIENVSLVSSYGTSDKVETVVSTGDNKAAIIKVETAASSNTLASGNELKTILEQIKLKVTSAASTTIGSVTLEKLGGNGSAVTGSSSGDYYTFDLATSTSGFSTDNEIANNSEAYYLVKVNVTAKGTGDNDDWIKVDLDNLNGTDGDCDAGGANFQWKDGDNATAKYDLRISGKSNVDGTKIDES